MRIWIIAILCLVCTDPAQAERKVVIGKDSCVIEARFKKQNTELLNGIQLRCATQSGVYKKRRLIGEQGGDWPTVDWQNLHVGDEATCDVSAYVLSELPNYFYVEAREFEHCTIVKPNVAVEALPPATSGQQ